MNSWEQRFAGVLHRLHLDSVKRKILVFSLIATLIPSVTIGWLFYEYADRFVTDKVTEQLTDTAGQNVREFDLWLKERIYEVRVFSSSYEVSENLDTVTRARTTSANKALALRRLTDYLGSVRGKFGDYEELVVVNAKTSTVATSAAEVSTLNFPADWQARAKADTPITGQAYRDPKLGKMVMLIAAPVRALDRRFVGMLAVKLNFHSIEGILERSARAASGASYLLSADGAVIASLRQATEAGDGTAVLEAAGRAAIDQPLLEYDGLNGVPVIGVVEKVPQLDWGVVTEIPKSEVYSQTMLIRKLTVAIALVLLLAIGLAAYVLGLTIVQPLNRLADGATRIAGGDLTVDLPVIGRGEVGYLTETFNGMVDRLRHSQEELAAINVTLTESNRALHTLSITDSLTGLYNRKHVMEVLQNVVSRASECGHPASVAMIDTDYFKEYNDSLGHQAGDALLK